MFLEKFTCSKLFWKFVSLFSLLFFMPFGWKPAMHWYFLSRQHTPLIHHCNSCCNGMESNCHSLLCNISPEATNCTVSSDLLVWTLAQFCQWLLLTCWPAVRVVSVELTVCLSLASVSLLGCFSPAPGSSSRRCLFLLLTLHCLLTEAAHRSADPSALSGSHLSR